jgi:hypothetical protein
VTAVLAIWQKLPSPSAAYLQVTRMDSMRLSVILIPHRADLRIGLWKRVPHKEPGCFLILVYQIKKARDYAKQTADIKDETDMFGKTADLRLHRAME